MKIRPALILIVLGLLSISVASCGGSDRETEIAVIVALTQTAAAQQPPVEVAATEAPAQTEAPAPAATEEPAPAAPLSGYQPYDPASTALLNASISASTGLVGNISTGVPFDDFVTGQSGTASQITYSATNATLPAGADPFRSALDTLIAEDWVEDMNYGAGGPTGIQTGLRKDTTVCLLAYSRQPIDRALCSANEPISSCFDKLTPEQILYSMTLTCSTYFP